MSRCICFSTICGEAFPYYMANLFHTSGITFPHNVEKEECRHVWVSLPRVCEYHIGVGWLCVWNKLLSSYNSERSVKSDFTKFFKNTCGTPTA